MRQDGEADTEEREDQTEDGSRVLHHDHRQLRGLGLADVLQDRHALTILLALLESGVQASTLGTCRDDGHDQRHPPPLGVEQFVRLTGESVADLLVRRVQGEQSTDAEDDDGDDVAGDVPGPLVTERMVLVGLLVGSFASDHEDDLVGGVGHRVNGLGKHRGCAGQGPCEGLRHGNREVGRGSGNDRLAASALLLRLLGLVRLPSHVGLTHDISSRRSSPRAR